MSGVRGEGGAVEDDLYRWMVAASPDGLWVIDEEGLTVFANARMAQMLGRDPSEMVGFSVFDAVDEVGKGQFRHHLDELASKGEPGDNIECSLLDAHGDRFWALVSHTPLVDERGVHRGWMHRVSEHSAQRKLLDQLAEAQSIAKIGSWEWDVGADRVSWSDELYRIYGLDRTDLTPTYEGFLSRIHADDRGHVSDVVGAALASEDSFEFDARVVQSSGEIVWIRGRGLVTRDPEGRAIRMGGTTQDITEKKDAEQALGLITAMATAANESATLDEALPAIFVEVARHTTWRPVLGSVVDAEGNLAEPIRAKEGTGASTLPVEVGMEFAARAAADQAVVAELSPDGTTIVAVPVVNEGRVACVVVLDMRSAAPPVASDATTISQITALFARVADREWTAERLEHARDAAMEASRAKSEFLATMSHEIRTPLNGVIGLSELLGRTELTPYQRRLSDGIDQAGRVLLGLVNDILDLSKIEAGRLDLESVDFDPAAVLERSVALLAERARAKSLDLSVSHGPEVPFLVSGDPVRFGQVVANLTTNAVKFTDVGSVVVHLGLERMTAAGPVLRVEVTDTGAGIAPHVRSKLFESFSQGDSSTTREYGGTGLGLAISRQIVTAFGGEIGVESEPGHGSTFWFTAAFEAATAGSVGRSESQAAAVSGLLVLVVGADVAHRARIEEQLSAWSMTVTSAASGVEGLVQLDRAVSSGSPVDVVVLDDPASGATGLQVARMIRSDDRFAGVRVVLVCAHVPPPDVASAKEAGVDAILTAPVMPSSLFDAMADLVGRHLATESARPLGVSPGSEGHLGTVLVVEDNEVNQLVAQGVLESLGYAVVLAGNGVEGVEAHRTHGDEFVAVLMDCQMPQMDGYAATRAIRSREQQGHHLPVIAMTASAIAGERERCLQAGMDDFLTKPIDVALLASTLRRWAGEGPSPRSHGAVPVPTGARDEAAAAASAAEAASAAVLDHGRLEELLDVDPGDPSMVLRFIDRFGIGAQQRLAELRQARAAGDAEAQGRVAHGLKGTAANLGATALADACRMVEELGAAGQLADEALVAHVADELDHAVTALEDYAATLRRPG
ncbi:response regulator [Terrabacter ginsenosidimutans]|uniref:response regulator n=1 Tax=Terrabacter ginsenosidimutans TaxID=490575 RepID=UPI0031E4EB05